MKTKEKKIETAEKLNAKRFSVTMAMLTELATNQQLFINFKKNSRTKRRYEGTNNHAIRKSNDKTNRIIQRTNKMIEIAKTIVDIGLVTISVLYIGIALSQIKPNRK